MLTEWPAGLREPWEHQHAAYDVLGKLWHSGRRGVGLFSDMGTGKSLVAVALCRAYGFERILIISGTKAMVKEWPRILEAETVGAIVGVPLVGPITKRAAVVRELQLTRPTAVITNVESIWRGELGLELERVPWDCIIVDESQKIKAAGTKASLFAFRLAKLSGAYRMCMTGTPLHDKPVDIYGQYRFLDASIFGTDFASFKYRYCIEKEVKENVRIVVGYRKDTEPELRAKIKEISFSVPGTVLDLPPVHEPDYRTFELDPANRKRYKTMKDAGVLDFGPKGFTIGSNDLVRLTRLQQLTSGFLPATTFDNVETILPLGTEREDALADLLDEFNPDEPVVVFAKFEYDLQRIRALADRSGRAYFEQSGRHDDWQAFRAGNMPGELIGVQIQAGGAGIDLSRARYGIFYSHGFSFGDYRQAKKRLHRPGQTRTTFLYHIVAADTVDVDILKAMREKRSVDARILAM